MVLGSADLPRGLVLVDVRSTVQVSFSRAAPTSAVGGRRG